MFSFHCEAVITGDVATIWKIWTDVDRWPEWDPTKELARLDGPFAEGTTGWVKQRGNLGGPMTITLVEVGRRWTTECPLPLGRVVFDHRLNPMGDERTQVIKTVEVRGGFTSLFRLIVAAKMRRDIIRAFIALEELVQAQNRP